MANKRPKPEEIVSKLRQVQVLMGQGMPRLEAMITIARYGGTTRPRPQRAVATAILFVLNVPTA